MSISIWKGFGNMWQIIPFQIAAAVGLDLLFGDPRRWPHVARLTGRLSNWYEERLTKRAQRTVVIGAVFWASVVGTLLALYTFARRLCALFGPRAVQALDILIIYQATSSTEL